MKEKIRMKYAALLTGGSRREGTRSAILAAGRSTTPYDRLCEAYDKEFAPDGDLEMRLVGELVDIRWRLDHIRGYVKRCESGASLTRRATPEGLREIARFDARLLKHYEEIFADFFSQRRTSGD